MAIYENGKKVLAQYENGKKVLSEYDYGRLVYSAEVVEGWEAYGELGEYIKPLDNSSVINTVLVAKGTNNKITIEMQSGFRYGSRISATNNAFCAYSANLNSYTAFMGDSYVSGLSIDLTARNVLEHKNGEVKLNGEIVKSYTPYNYTSDLPLHLFRFNGNNTTVIGECYRFDFEQNDEFLCKYRPLYLTKQPITDAVGRVHNIGDWVMYDLVTNTVPAHYGSFTGATAAQILALQQQALQSLGVESSDDINTNQQQLNSLGVKI